MKKILALIITIILCFNSFAVGAYEKIDSTNKTKAIKELILSKKELSNSYKGKKYIVIIDKFIEKNKFNEKELVKIYNKIQPILNGGKIKNSETINIIKYMDARITISLIGLYEKVPQEVEINDDMINDSDKKIIEDKIVSLQLNALEKGTSLIESITNEFEKTSNYEETGNLEIDVNLDHESFGSFEGNLKINDYSSKASGFDAELKGEIEALINAIPNGEEEIKLQLNTMVDFISKDGNMYLLLEKFNILEEKGVNDLKDFLEKAKEIAKENKYIKYSDPETQIGMNILKSINPANIINDSKTILSKPLVSAYKKEGNKYYLIPTKYACDSFKELSNKFDPFSPSKCTNSQYKNLVKEVIESGTFYAEILSNEKTKIGFIGKKEFGIQKNEGYIIFDENKILEIKYEIDAGDDGELNIEYKNKSILNISILSNEGEGNFISTLNNDNKFEKIDFSFQANNYGEKIKTSLTLNNHIINGLFNISNNNSDEEFNGTIKGKTNHSDNLSELEIKYKGVDGKKEVLNGTISFGNSKIYFENYYESKKDKFLILISATIDDNYIPIDGEFKINSLTKSGHYDYETYQYIYNDNFSKVLDIDIKINNKSISGTTEILDNGEKIITIEHLGNYGSKIFKLDNKFEIGKTYSMYINQTGGTVSGNVNIDFDASYNKNNANIFINLFFGSDEIFDFSINNTGKRELKKVYIPTPTNTIDYKEIFDIEDNNYYNY